MAVAHRHGGAALKKCRSSMGRAPGKAFLALFFSWAADFY